MRLEFWKGKCWVLWVFSGDWEVNSEMVWSWNGGAEVLDVLGGFRGGIGRCLRAVGCSGSDGKEEEEEFEVIITPSDFEIVKKAFDDKEMEYNVAEVSMVPQSTIKLEGKKAEQMLNLMEALEDNDDVNNLYANFDIPDKVMEALGG